METRRRNEKIIKRDGKKKKKSPFAHNKIQYIIINTYIFQIAAAYIIGLLSPRRSRYIYIYIYTHTGCAITTRRCNDNNNNNTYNTGIPFQCLGVGDSGEGSGWSLDG